MSVFSERLLELREKRNIMQKDVASSVDVPLRTYQRYEYGEIVPKFTTVIKLADLFDVSLDYLAGRTDTP